MIRRAVMALVLAAMAGGVAQAQPYPSRTIKLVSPFPPGGGTDFLARTVAQHLGDMNKWNIVVENKAGGGGTIGLGETKRGQPDGYELVVGQFDNLVLAPWISKVAFDSTKDFAPIALFGKTPIVFVVRKDSRFQSFADAVAAVRAAPNDVTIGSAGTGTITHIIIELIRSRGESQFRHVPYRGSTPALTDLLGGHVDMIGASIASAYPLIKSGDVRALAVSGEARSRSLPDVPTLGEQGVKGIAVNTWYGLLAPAGLPDEIAQRLNKDVNAVVQRPDVVAKLAEQGVEPAPISPQAFGTMIREDYATWQKIIGDLGFKRE